MNGYRQAALCLHGLSDEDRIWLMGKLPKTQSSRLQEMLAELEEIGIPKDAYWPDEYSDTSATDKSLINNQDIAVSYLNKSNPKLISALLSSEPDFVIATILSIYDWSWRSDFFDGFDEVRKKSITNECERVPSNIGQQVLKALVESVYEKLESDADSLESIVAQRERDNKFTAFRSRRRFWRLPWKG